MKARASAGALAAAVLTAPAPARADPPARAGLSLGATAALDSFAQGGGAPPLCCGERDSWTARGPAFALRAGYGLTRWFEPALELGASFQRASGATAVSMTTTTATLAAYFLLGSERIVFQPGLYLRTGRDRATFDYASGATHTHQVIDQGVSAPGVSLGVDVLVLPHLGAGAFVRGDVPGLSQVDYSAGVAFTWYGVVRSL